MRKFYGMLAGVAAAVLVGYGTGQAATFTSDHCDPLCGPQANGFATITGTQVGVDTVSVTITPLNGNGLVGGLNGLTTFTFNSLQNQAITFNFGANAALFDVSNSATNTANAGAISQDGFGSFEYGFNYIGGSGGSNPFFGPLTFTLSGAGLTLASFTELSTNPPGNVPAFMALDIISALGGVGNTGVVDCCSPGVTPFDNPPEVPIPGAVWLFASGVAGLGALLRRRRKQQQVSASA